MKGRRLVVGAGGHGRSVAEAVLMAGTALGPGETRP